MLLLSSLGWVLVCLSTEEVRVVGLVIPLKRQAEFDRLLPTPLDAVLIFLSLERNLPFSGSFDLSQWTCRVGKAAAIFARL